MGTAGAPDTARRAEASGWPGAADGPELAFAGLAQQAALLRSREVSARELVELSLERIEVSQPRLNAFRVICAEAALTAADQADAQLRGDGDANAPLLGVPVAIKDDVDLAGHSTPSAAAERSRPAARTRSWCGD